MARPSIAAVDRRTLTLKFRVNAAEAALIETKRAALGLPLSEYARRQAIEGAIIERASLADRQLIQQIAAVGNNLNQIARVANATGELHPDTEERLNGTLDVLEGLIEELIA